uniref:Tudor domain-containing protein n=1 Tax=Glossina brevipalpis TaxID=37001 RepID=A0A1A9W7R1_9MUSC
MHNPNLTVVKAILKALIVSHSETMTVRRLNNYYRDVEADDIPFLYFGYNNLEEFLLSIPDTLTLFDDGYSSIVRIANNGVPRNIYKTVREQKIKHESCNHIIKDSKCNANEKINKNELLNDLNDSKACRREAQQICSKSANDSKRSSRIVQNTKPKIDYNGQLNNIVRNLKHFQLRSFDELNRSVSREEKSRIIQRLSREQRKKRKASTFIKKDTYSTAEEKLEQKVRSSNLSKCKEKVQQIPKYNKVFHSQPPALKRINNTSFNNLVATSNNKNLLEKNDSSDQLSNLDDSLPSLESEQWDEQNLPADYEEKYPVSPRLLQERIEERKISKSVEEKKNSKVEKNLLLGDSNKCDKVAQQKPRYNRNAYNQTRTFSKSTSEKYLVTAGKNESQTKNLLEKIDSNDQLSNLDESLPSLEFEWRDEENLSADYEEKSRMIPKLLQERREERKITTSVEKEINSKVEKKALLRDLTKYGGIAQHRLKIHKNAYNQPTAVIVLNNTSVNNSMAGGDNRNNSKNPLKKIDINDQVDNLERTLESSEHKSWGKVILSSLNEWKCPTTQKLLREQKQKHQNSKRINKIAHSTVRQEAQMKDLLNHSQKEARFNKKEDTGNKLLFTATLRSDRETAYDNENHAKSAPKMVEINNELDGDKISLKRVNFWHSDLENELKEALPKFALQQLGIGADIPANAIYFGFTFTQMYNLPEGIFRDSRSEIIINEIHSPYKFWFHFYKSNLNLDRLDHMSNSYKYFNDDVWRIPVDILAPNQVCVAFYEDYWYRAKIVSWPTNNKVKVSCVDYGNIAEVHVTQIRFLHTYFANIPIQALRGSLTSVKPLHTHWCHSATELFRNMALNTVVEADVVDIDYTQRIYYIGINKKMTDISTYLVEQHLARYNKSWDLRRLYQEFPTFTMLESGEYPSFSELVQLLEQGYDYERIYDPLIQRLTMPRDPTKAPAELHRFPFNLISYTNPFYAEIIKELKSKEISHRHIPG